jgi:hypothetical protein
VSAPLPRLTAHRREWLTESSTCRYEDLQILLANYDAVPGLLERVIPEDWTPTSANVNALPGPLRLYICHLETICDPAGDQARLVVQWHVIAQLMAHSRVLARVRELLAETVR